jgi:hypothetical protein
MQQIYQYPIFTVQIVGFLLVLGCVELGWYLGARSEGLISQNLTAMEQSVLGLLALILGFTFAMALTRFEARRMAVLNEANSIATTALRARLLPDAPREQVLKLLREYTQLRVDYIRLGMPFSNVQSAVKRSNTIQDQLWDQAKEIAIKDKSMVPTGLFIQSLNEMIDGQGKRLSALRDNLPEVILLLLFVMTSAACGLAGYASGAEPKRKRVPVYITGFLACAVVLLILDLDRPNTGFITISQQPMIDTLSAILSYSN